MIARLPLWARSWPGDVLDVCKLVTSEEAARGGAATLGMLAATLAVEQTRSLQFVLRPDGPDVGVLLMLK